MALATHRGENHPSLGGAMGLRIEDISRYHEAVSMPIGEFSMMC